MKTLQESVNESLKKSDKFTKQDLEQLKADWNNIVELKKRGFFKDLLKDAKQEQIDAFTKMLNDTRWEDIKDEAEQYNKTH